MEQELRQQLLHEVTRIGDELLSQAIHYKSGMAWRTLRLDDEKKEQWLELDNVYSGVSGIVLFFIELYKQTKKKDYLDAVVEGVRWLDHFCQNRPAASYAFFTGQMGVAYCMIKAFEITKDAKHLAQALQIAKQSDTFLASPTVADDLLNGTSGTLLGLLHLHAATGEEWLLEKIDLFLDHLIQKAHHGPVGLYWDRTPQNIRGLCGFSHGAAGVGFVFLELGHYFQNDAFFWLARQAFLYESYLFSHAENNWPDLRKGAYTQEEFRTHEEAYRKGDLDFFTQPKFSNAWCHGAAGIGLSRLRAFQILGDSTYERDIRSAIELTRTTDVEGDIRTYTLCHGAGGRAELFIEVYRVFRDRTYLSLAEAVAQKAIKCKQTQGLYISGFSGASGTREDTSLLMGNAGIGHFLLSVLEPLQTSSVLSPKIETICKCSSIPASYTSLTISKASIRRKTLETTFERTLFLAQNIIPEQLGAYFDDSESADGESEQEGLIKFLEGTIPSLPYPKQNLLSDAFALEREKVRMDRASASNAFLHWKAIVQGNDVMALLHQANDSILKLKLTLDPDVKIEQTGWDWDPTHPENWIGNLELATDSHPVLLKRTAKGVLEIKLTPFSYAVLTPFKNEQCAEKVVHNILEIVGAAPSKRNQVQDSIIQQIKQGIQAGFLVEA